jgi:tetratricopeptide (TPR) repeat protein
VAEAVPVQRSSSDLVGREHELAELGQAVARAASGRGSLWMLSGEPGVGKTRLADEAEELAREAGLATYWGRCWEGGGAPAYWAWTQVVRAMQRSAPGATDGLGPLGAEPRAGEETEDARFALFDAFTGYVEERSAEQPMLLVLDDLHAADVPSLLLLEFLARDLRRLPVVVVATMRPEELDAETRDVMARIAREATPLWIAGLDPGEVEALVQLRTGATQDPRVAEALHDATEGNPFFLREVVRLLHAEGRLDQPERLREGLPLPAGVRDAVRRRLEPLSPDTLVVLATAAVLGKEFTLPALEGATGREGGLELLQEAFDRRVLAGAGAPGRMRFTHALFREVLLEGLSARERAEAHRRCAEALERLYADDPEPRLAELAHHWLEAVPAVPPERGIDLAAQAGDRSMSLLAYEEAARLYRRALAALELRATGSDPGRRRDLLLELGAALRKAGDPVSAREGFLEAAELSARLGEPERQAQAALGYAGRYWTSGVVDEQVIAVLERALEALGPEDTLLRAAVLARLSTELYYAPSDDADALSAEAVGMAERIGDAGALASVLDARLAATWGPDNLDERLALSRRAQELAEAAGDRETALRDGAFLVTCLLERGEMAEADAQLESLRSRARYLHQPRFLWHVDTLRSLRALMAGHLDEAGRLAERALSAGVQADERNARHTHAIQMSTQRYLEGRLDEIEVPLRAFVERYPTLAGWRCTLALLLAEQGRAPEAERELEIAAAADFGGQRRDSHWLLASCRAADCAAKLGHQAVAADLREQLLPYAGRQVVLGRVATISIGSAARYVGLAEAATGRTDDAVGRLEAAIADNTRWGARPWVAQAELDLAGILLERDADGDHERAARLAERARATAAELGLAFVVARAEPLAERARAGS